MRVEQWRAIRAFLIGIRCGLIGVAQVLIWWSLLVATSGVAVALWLLIWPTFRRVAWS